MRDGNWKMIISSKKFELYDLGNDIAEQNNLTETHPERAQGDDDRSGGKTTWRFGD